MCLGIPGRIVTIDDVARKLATVDVSGVKRQVKALIGVSTVCLGLMTMLAHLP